MNNGCDWKEAEGKGGIFTVVLEETSSKHFPLSWLLLLSRCPRYEISLWSVCCASSVPSHPLLHPQPLFAGEGLLETQHRCSVSAAQHQPRHWCVVNTLLPTNTKEQYCKYCSFLVLVSLEPKQQPPKGFPVFAFLEHYIISHQLYTVYSSKMFYNSSMKIAHYHYKRENNML